MLSYWKSDIQEQIPATFHVIFLNMYLKKASKYVIWNMMILSWNKCFDLPGIERGGRMERWDN